MKLYRTSNGIYLRDASDGVARIEKLNWDELLRQEDLYATCKRFLADAREVSASFSEDSILAPIVSQEVWAAGVTYFRSRSARMEESKEAGGGSFYDRVYQAARPELFFKANARRVVGHMQEVRIRGDASWSVPEPELTLLISPGGKITGYTIGNDMSSRDIEGENPLYLPQAKVYDGSCALGPCIYLAAQPIARETKIDIVITRDQREAFSGSVALTELKRELDSLVEYLYRDNSFPDGCFLMTGTGIVPPDSFKLQSRDQISITIEGIGTLTNTVQ